MAYLQCTLVTGTQNVLTVAGSGSVSCTTISSINGNNGRLFEVTDDLSSSVFSANTIAGLPVIEAFANYCFVAGQYNGHKLEVTSSSIRGGIYTLASGCNSVVTGGACNLGYGACSFLGGGFQNNTVNNYSTIVGGQSNTTLADHSNILGGFNNITTGNYSTISGGLYNTNSGYGSIVGGGSNNGAYCAYTTLSGGYYNIIVAGGGTIGGGESNTASGLASTIAGGIQNTASGSYAAILGGRGTTVSGAYSGGGGCCLSATCGCTFYWNNFCATGSMWAVAFNVTSDERLKNVQCTVKSCDSINPIYFNWKEGDESIINIGYSAQNVKEILPNTVRIDEKGYHNVDYHQVHIYKITKLEERITELEEIIKKIQ